MGCDNGDSMAAMRATATAAAGQRQGGDKGSGEVSNEGGDKSNDKCISGSDDGAEWTQGLDVWTGG